MKNGIEIRVSNTSGEGSLKKYSEFIARKQGLRVVTIVILMLLATAVFLSFLSARSMKKVVADEFNSQQLELARHAAGILTEKFKILKRELITLGLSPSIQYFEVVSWANRMKISLSTVKEYGVTRIILINAEGTEAYSTTYPDEALVEKRAYRQQDFFKWCRQLETKAGSMQAS